MSTLVRALIALMIAALVPLSTGGAASAKVEEPRYRLKAISHNIAGGPMNLGVPRAAARKVVAREERVTLAALEGQIDTYQPDVVGLQEVCYSQYLALREDYPSWSTEFVPMQTAHAKCLVGDNPAQGQVLMSPYPWTNYNVTDLGYDDGAKDFTLACADVAVPALAKPVYACNTHLRVNATDPTGEFKIGLLQNVADATSAYTAGKTVMWTCDCNANPRAIGMNSIYRLALDNTFTGPGRFYEADQTDPNRCPDGPCRSGSTGVDHVFFSRNTASGGRLSAGKVDAPLSDHRIYRSWAEVTGVA